MLLRHDTFLNDLRIGTFLLVDWLLYFISIQISVKNYVNLIERVSRKSQNSLKRVLDEEPTTNSITLDILTENHQINRLYCF